MQPALYKKNPPLWLEALQTVSAVLVVVAFVDLLGADVSVSLLLAFTAAAVALLILLVIARRHPKPVLFIHEGMLHFRQDVYIPVRIAKIPISEVEWIQLSGLPRRRGFIFGLRSGETIEVKPMLQNGPLEEEVVRFLQQHVGDALPVQENDRLVGMITDRDITVRAVAEGRGPDTPIREAMSPEIKYCFEDQSIEEVTRHQSDRP